LSINANNDKWIIEQTGGAAMGSSRAPIRFSPFERRGKWPSDHKDRSKVQGHAKIRNPKSEIRIGSPFVTFAICCG
jgi:hypothetical protein